VRRRRDSAVVGFRYWQARARLTLGAGALRGAAHVRIGVPRRAGIRGSARDTAYQRRRGRPRIDRRRGRNTAYTSTAGAWLGYISGLMPRSPEAKSAPRDRSPSASERPSASAGAAGGKRLDPYSLRSRIVGKAAGVFGKRGAADTTVEDILQAAGVSRRTFYRFFQSKEDVLDALHEIGCNMLIGAARQAMARPADEGTTADPRERVERLKRALEAYVEYHVTVGPNVMHVVQGESMRAGSKLGPRRRAFFDTMVEIFAGEYEKTTGTRVDPLLLRSLLVAMEGVSLMLRVESENGTFDMERAKRVMQRIVLATIAAPAGDIVPPIPVLPPEST
jgi:AcrR family transcriptional regulator